MSAVPKPRQPMRMMIVDDSNVMRRRIGVPSRMTSSKWSAPRSTAWTR